MLGGKLAWNGFLISIKTLEISADYSKYTNTHVENHVTVPSRHVGEALLSLLNRSVVTRAHPLLLDGLLNSRFIVALNIYQSFLLSAAKLYVVLARLQGVIIT